MYQFNALFLNKIIINTNSFDFTFLLTFSYSLCHTFHSHKAHCKKALCNPGSTDSCRFARHSRHGWDYKCNGDHRTDPTSHADTDRPLCAAGKGTHSSCIAGCTFGPSSLRHTGSVPWLGHKWMWEGGTDRLWSKWTSTSPPHRCSCHRQGHISHDVHICSCSGTSCPSGWAGTSTHQWLGHRAHEGDRDRALDNPAPKNQEDKLWRIKQFRTIITRYALCVYMGESLNNLFNRYIQTHTNATTMCFLSIGYFQISLVLYSCQVMWFW